MEILAIVKKLSSLSGVPDVVVSGSCDSYTMVNELSGHEQP